MKIFFVFFWICVFQQIDSNFGTILVIRPLPECMTVDQFNKATQILCENRSNETLWQQVVDCHYPITEKFLRRSGAANCPVPQAADPMDFSNNIRDVFLNFCSLIAGHFLNRFMGEHCYVYGGEIGAVSILPHTRELALAKHIYGADINCNIGKCILSMGLH